MQDKCNLIDGYSEGDDVAVDFDLRGREWNGKYFTNLQAWRIARADGAAASEGGADTAAFPTPKPVAAGDDFDDDIPF